jgi:DNA-binding transcriptional regulator/RsmH inhibitor MraZ
MDELFIGSAVCKVSRRGDLMLPTSFRKTARVRSTTPDIRLFADLDPAGCLILCDRASLTRAYLAADGADRDAVRRRLLAFAVQIDVQPNGQFALPAATRARIGLGDRALLVATGDQIEIWDVDQLLERGTGDLARLVRLHLNLQTHSDGADHEIAMSSPRPPRRATVGGKSRLSVQPVPPVPLRHDPLHGVRLQ